MALTVTTPPAGGKVGPGYLILLSGAAGPVALDDVYFANLFGAGGSFCQGNSIAHGFTTGALVLGRYEFATHATNSQNVQVNAGDAVSIVLTRTNSAGSFIETTTTTGFVYDPLGGLWSLAAYTLESVGSSGLAAVLAAVQRTYTTP